MSDEKYINSITLQYLLNPSIHNKLHTIERPCDTELMNDILFYRKRITQLTKRMCKNEFINNSYKSAFLNYASFLVYNLKQEDEKDIYQQEYDDLEKDKVENDISNKDEIINENDSSLQDAPCDLGDNLILRQNKNTYNLDKYITRTQIKDITKILPKQRIADITDPMLKRKGIKKE